MVEEEKSAVIILKISTDNISIRLDNHGFSYYELNGILHEVITNNMLLKVEQEQLTEEKKE